ncbi:MAG: histidine kinase [Patulibacter minatonensis]
MLRRWARIRRGLAAHPRRVDAALAVVGFLALVGSHTLAVELMREADATAQRPPLGWVVVGLAATALPLAWRRRAPLSALMAATFGFALGQVLGVDEGNVTALIIATLAYNAAAYGRPDRRRVTCGGALALIVVVLLVEQFVAYSPESWEEAVYLVIILAFNISLYCAMWGLGAAIATGRERAVRLAEQADELRRERDASARQAVFVERVRIARELHDVVAHHVSVMGLQAGAGRMVLATDPAKARDALGSIEASSRQAVAELQGLLAFLRQDGDDDAPGTELARPGLAQVPQLVASARQWGLEVSFRADPTGVAAGSTIDTSAYRIVQEALTNTLKHAGAKRVDVAVWADDDILQITVRDDGIGRPVPPPVGGTELALQPEAEGVPRRGLGLVGMRERTVLHGGWFHAGPQMNGGFAVHAQLPLEGRPA